MLARFASGVFVALGIADLAFLNLILAPRLEAEQVRHAEPRISAPSPSVIGPEPRTAEPRPIEIARAPKEASSAVEPPRAPEIARAKEASEPALRGKAVPDVLFELQSGFVTSLAATRSLEAVARALVADPARKVLLRGHADRLGRPAQNLRLSHRRAESVKRYLVDRGAPADRIVVEALGDAEPADTGDSPAAWAKNRRVEVLWR